MIVIFWVMSLTKIYINKLLIYQVNQKLKKLFQININGPNVNLNFYEPAVTKRNENKQHQLMNIGSCGLQLIHGAFKTGFEKSIGAYYVFHDFPKTNNTLQ